MSRQNDPSVSVFIYALIDPFTDEIRYVGKSIRPKQRLQNHCVEQTVTWRTNWIQSVLSQGKRPVLRILETLTYAENWRDAERRWIAQLKEKGVKLTNCTSGGDGVPNLPPEIRAKMSQTWKGRKHRPESLIKIGDASCGRWHTQEYKDMMSRIMTGRNVTWNDALRHSQEKLTADQVREIRLRLSEGSTQSALAIRFGVDKGTISNIKRKICYMWVE